MDQYKIWQGITKNKLLTFLLLFFILTIFAALTILISLGGAKSGTNPAGYDYSYDSSLGTISSPMAFESAPSFSTGLFDFSSREAADTGKSYDSGASVGFSEIEIKKGKISAKSEDVDSDFDKLKDFVAENKGYIESSKKSELATFSRINAQVRIPVGDFNDFIEKINNNFKVETFEIIDYRIDVQKQIDELDIIWQAIEDYNQLREETLRFGPSKDQIELLSLIADKSQRLARQKSELERDLGGKQKQADLATIDITFHQRLKSDLWPSDLGNLFRDRLSWAIDTVLTTLTTILANSVVLLVKVIEYIVYAIIIILPIMFAWGLIKKLRARLKNKPQEQQ